MSVWILRSSTSWSAVDKCRKRLASETEKCGIGSSSMPLFHCFNMAHAHDVPDVRRAVVDQLPIGSPTATKKASG
jgi:hypothetical protein